MASPSCRECRFWRDPVVAYRCSDVGFKECFAIKSRQDIEDEAGLTEEEKLKGYDWELQEKKELAAIRAAGAYTVDASDYYSALFTGPEFYCCRFEAVK
jgi:hypothetical protein